ncbi:MAG: hypothetical protein WCD81_05255 [Candidatus Bathyarchaeia archaeon]
MALDCYFSGKEILVDAVGWGDLLLGVVVGALCPPNPMLMERRIPVSSFQPPEFQNKKYLDDAVKIADEIIQVMQPEVGTCFKVCSEYVLSSVRKHLQNRGFNVQTVENTGELKDMVDRGYVRWCVEEGVPEEILRDKTRFWTLLEWVAERPNLRESLVKTGWASWERKWREEIYKKPPKLRG